MYYQQASPSNLRPSHSLLPISHPSAILQLHKFHLLHELNIACLEWPPSNYSQSPTLLKHKKIASNVSEETPPSNTHTCSGRGMHQTIVPKTHCNSLCFFYIQKSLGSYPVEAKEMQFSSQWSNWNGVL